MCYFKYLQDTPKPFVHIKDTEPIEQLINTKFK